MEDFGDFSDLDVIGNGEWRFQSRKSRECFVRLLLHTLRIEKLAESVYGILCGNINISRILSFDCRRMHS